MKNITENRQASDGRAARHILEYVARSIAFAR
jgi:hypothetical protein